MVAGPGLGLRKIAAELGVGVETSYEAKKRAASILGGSRIGKGFSERQRRGCGVNWLVQNASRSNLSLDT